MWRASASTYWGLQCNGEDTTPPYSRTGTGRDHQREVHQPHEVMGYFDAKSCRSGFHTLRLYFSSFELVLQIDIGHLTLSDCWIFRTRLTGVSISWLVWQKHRNPQTVLIGQCWEGFTMHWIYGNDSRNYWAKCSLQYDPEEHQQINKRSSKEPIEGVVDLPL